MCRSNYRDAQGRLAFLSREFGYSSDAETVGEIKFLRALIRWADQERAEADRIAAECDAYRAQSIGPWPLKKD